jgi:F-type H+-transporting ATPase subunit delta
MLDLAEEQKKLDRLSDDFAFLQRMLKESREFFLLLKSPVVKKEKKKAILTELLKSQVAPETLQFLHLLTEKNREDILGTIISQFFELRDERLGIVNVEVRAATELTSDQHRRMEEQFEKMTKRKVRISFSLDKQLKGGFVARVADTMYDGSVRRQLELLREQFLEGQARN